MLMLTCALSVSRQVDQQRRHPQVHPQRRLPAACRAHRPPQRLGRQREPAVHLVRPAHRLGRLRLPALQPALHPRRLQAHRPRPGSQHLLPRPQELPAPGPGAADLLVAVFRYVACVAWPAVVASCAVYGLLANAEALRNEFVLVFVDSTLLVGDLNRHPQIYTSKYLQKSFSGLWRGRAVDIERPMWKSRSRLLTVPCPRLNLSSERHFLHPKSTSPHRGQMFIKPHS